jgi:hypothetical protein
MRMDLLGRKSKAEVAKLKGHLDYAIQTVRAQYGVVSELSVALSDYEAAMASLSRELEISNARVSMLESLLEKQKAPAISPTKRYMSEDEQELKWQLDNNFISLADYEHLLAELEFQNSDIELDPDYKPRPDLTY